ncbi:MAG: hypothetical protein LBC42_00885 [Puniceicoccales bacterium]|jgi:hypothetical protein|nr:hypothetical protein [Puniceicoccales bacterium]
MSRKRGENAMQPPENLSDFQDLAQASVFWELIKTMNNGVNPTIVASELAEFAPDMESFYMTGTDSFPFRLRYGFDEVEITGRTEPQIPDIPDEYRDEYSDDWLEYWMSNWDEYDHGSSRIVYYNVRTDGQYELSVRGGGEFVKVTPRGTTTPIFLHYTQLVMPSAKIFRRMNALIVTLGLVYQHMNYQAAYINDLLDEAERMQKQTAEFMKCYHTFSIYKATLSDGNSRIPMVNDDFGYARDFILKSVVIAVEPRYVYIQHEGHLGLVSGTPALGTYDVTTKIGYINSNLTMMWSGQIGDSTKTGESVFWKYFRGGDHDQTWGDGWRQEKNDPNQKDIIAEIDQWFNSLTGGTNGKVTNSADLQRVFSSTGKVTVGPNVDAASHYFAGATQEHICIYNRYDRHLKKIEYDFKTTGDSAPEEEYAYIPITQANMVSEYEYDDEDILFWVSREDLTSICDHLRFSNDEINNKISNCMMRVNVVSGDMQANFSTATAIIAKFEDTLKATTRNVR